MNARPRKRLRHDNSPAKYAQSQPSYDVHSVAGERSHEQDKLGETAHPKLSDSIDAVTGKSFLELASAAQQDTQPVETQQFQTFLFDPVSASKKRRRRFTKHSSEGVIGTLPLQSQDSDVEFENLVTDPPEHPTTLDNKEILSNVPRTPMFSLRQQSGESIEEEDTSAIRPSASVIRRNFGFAANLDLALSQAFGFTQDDALVPNNTKSDPVFARPSPQCNHAGPTPSKYFASSPPKNVEIETQLMALEPNKTKSSLSGSVKKISHDSVPRKPSGLTGKSSRTSVTGTARSNPLVIEEDSQVVYADPPFTVQKTRRNSVEVVQTSSKSGNVDSNIQRTPEGSPTSRKVGRSNATQFSDRVIDSQCSVEQGHRGGSPHSVARADTQKSQSIYSHLSPHKLERLGEETQAALNTSPPHGPPTLKSSASDSQEHLQSSPPPPENLHAHSLSQKTSSNGTVAIVDPERKGDEIHEHEVEQLETQDQNESMIDLGIGALTATQITSSIRKSQQETHRASQNSVSRTQGAHPALLETADTNAVTSRYQTAQSRQTNTVSDLQRPISDEQKQTDSPFKHKKLSDIAAEPSQSLSDLPGTGFSQDVPPDASEYEGLVGLLQSSGSSPVPSRRSKTTKGSMIDEPTMSHTHKGKRSLFQEARDDLPLADADVADHSVASIDEVDLVPSRVESSPELDLEIGSYRAFRVKNFPTSDAANKGKLVKPSKFLHATARKRAAARSTRDRDQNVYDVEETQFDVNSTKSTEPSQITTAAVDREDEGDGDAEAQRMPEVVTGNILFPNRIFAYYGGQYNACYTATCQKVLPTKGKGDKLEVVFDDESTAIIDADKWVFQLILRAGDIVKVDWPGTKRRNYTVLGVKRQLTKGEKGENIFTDAYGYQTVCVVARARDSVSSSNRVEANEMIIEVPIQAVTIPALELHKFEDRKFRPESTGVAQDATDAATEDRSHRSTPVRALRRSVAAASAPLASITRALSPASISSRTSFAERPSKSLFTNMAFAVSVGSDTDFKRGQIIRMLLDHGARVLENGFHELFEMARSDSLAKKQGTRTSEHQSVLQLTARSHGCGFTALLADSHARRPKHMQALALNLPVLHYKWVGESIDRETAQPWSKYLLPAGESSFLDNAVRSRSLKPYCPNSTDALLESVLSRRTAFFADQAVLFVTGKKLEGKRKLFKFLIEAMAPKFLLLVPDLNAAIQVFKQQTLQWLFVESNEVAAAEKLFEKEKCWIVDDEYIVQSLILGELAD